jgi:hypothetical protein
MNKNVPQVDVDPLRPEIISIENDEMHTLLYN